MVKYIMTGRYSKLLGLITVAVATFLSVSCAGKWNMHTVAYPVDAKGFSEEIQWNSNVLTSTTASDTNKADASIRLSMLYAHHRNPSQDYAKALKYLKRGLQLDKQAASNDMLINMREILENAASTGSGGKRCSAIAAENERLKETIKQLNELEIELEKRRKLIR